MSSVDSTEWSDFSRSCLRPARATAPQTAFAVRNRITPYLRSAILPALGYGPLGPRLRRNGLADTDLIAPCLRSQPFFPLSPLRGGPLGPRLRKRPRR